MFLFLFFFVFVLASLCSLLHFLFPLNMCQLGNFGNGPNGKELTLMAPSLRLQTLTPLAGSLALVGDSGAITGRSDVQLAIYKDTGGASSSVGTQDALRPAEVTHKHYK